MEIVLFRPKRSHWCHFKRRGYLMEYWIQHLHFNIDQYIYIRGELQIKLCSVAIELIFFHQQQLPSTTLKILKLWKPLHWAKSSWRFASMYCLAVLEWFTWIYHNMDPTSPLISICNLQEYLLLCDLIWICNGKHSWYIYDIHRLFMRYMYIRFITHYFKTDIQSKKIHKDH